MLGLMNWLRRWSKNCLANARFFGPGVLACDRLSATTRAPSDLDRFRQVAMPDSVKPWSAFSHVKVLHRWSGQLAKLVADKGASDEWRLNGHAVLLEHADVERCIDLCRRIAEDAGMAFYRVPSCDVVTFPFDDHATLKRIGPALIFLEPGDWCLQPDAKDSEIEAIQTRIADAARAFDPGRPVVFFTSVGELESFSSGLMQVDAFDRVFSLPNASPVELGERFFEWIGRSACSSALLANPEKMGRLFQVEIGDTRQRDLVVIALRRFAADENRPLEFVDVIGVLLSDTACIEASDSATPESLRLTAYHEAGHALMAMLVSEGENVPEYTGIRRIRRHLGFTVESYTYAANVAGGMSYSGFVGKIRTCLAGRAAEELAVGPAGITRGSESDLAHASELACAAFSEWGFCPDMADPDKNSSRGLMIAAAEPCQAEVANLSGQVREFLDAQYKQTMAMLAEQRNALDALGAVLLRDTYIDQATLATIRALILTPEMRAAFAKQSD